MEILKGLSRSLADDSERGPKSCRHSRNLGHDLDSMTAEPARARALWGGGSAVIGIADPGYNDPVIMCGEFSKRGIMVGGLVAKPRTNESKSRAEGPILCTGRAEVLGARQG